MLQTLREHAGGWFAKLLFAILVASFALWGVGDVFRSYTSMRPVATVGGEKISQEAFAQALERARAYLQQMSKGQLTPDQIKAMGLQKKALNDLINQALVLQDISHLKLSVTEAAIRSHIQSIPAFQNEQGKFDKKAFDYLLQHNHMTELGFIEEVRSDLLRQQLLGALSSGMHLPKSYIKTLFKALEEKRVFVSVFIPLTKMVVSEKPSDTVLEQFYQGNKEQFTRPEYRKVNLLVIDPKEMRIVIPPAVVREEAERRLAEFETPEKREVKQIVFSTKELAEKGLESLRKGRPMASVARDLKVEFKDLGLVSKQQVPDISAEEIFKLELGKVTDSIETPFGLSVYTVTKIQPAEVPKVETIEPKIREEMRVQKANDVMFEIKNEMEDALAGGGSLAEISSEISKKHQLDLGQVKIIEAVDKQGNDRSGKSILADAIKTQALEQIFALSEGGASNVVDVRDGPSFVVHVDKVTSSFVPEFKDIKDQVSKAWVTSKQYEAAAQLAQSLVKDAKSVSELTKLASKNKLTIETLEPMSRLEVEKNKKLQQRYTANLLHQMFGLSPERSIAGPAKDGFTVVMFQKVLPLNEEEAKKKFDKFNESIQGLAQRDVISLYVEGLKKKYTVSINETIFESVIGGQARE